MFITYDGVAGELVRVDDRYCDSMGAYQVATIRNADGDHRVSNRFDTGHAFPRIAPTDDYEQRMASLARHFMRKRDRFNALGTRAGRALAIIANDRAWRVRAKIN